jgi:hypothetical protein
MTTSSNQKVMGAAAALLCGVQLIDVPEVWQAGHHLVAAVVTLAALAGAALGVSNIFRPGLEPPAPAHGRGYGGWNAKVNFSFFCYFLATIAVSLVKPWGLRSLTGIVGVFGMVATILFAVRTHRARKRAV